MDTFELEDLNPYGLMYQTGYPNHEVENAALFIKEYLGYRKVLG